MPDPTPAEIDADRPADCAFWVAETPEQHRRRCPLGDECPSAAELPAAPAESHVDGPDGPGWDRDRIEAIWRGLRIGGDEASSAQIRGLLADFDRRSRIEKARRAAQVSAEAEIERLRAERDQLDASHDRLAQRNAELVAERDAACADVERYRPLWSDPRAAPNRWTSEPNPHPRPYISTHTVLEDYDGAIRCSSDWPPEKRHAALDRTLGHVRPLVYEVEHLRAALDRLRDHAVLKGEALDKAVAKIERLRGSLMQAANKLSHYINLSDHLRADLDQARADLHAPRYIGGSSKK